MTGKQLTINGLMACGYVTDPDARTSKYMVFRPANVDADCRFFVGKSGALRFSSKGNATDSISLTDGIRHKAFQEVGQPHYRFESVEQARRTYETVVLTIRAKN